MDPYLYHIPDRRRSRGFHAWQAPLWASRKQLTVLAGALRGPELAVAVSPFAAQASQDLDLDLEEEGEATSPREALGLLQDADGLSASPLIRKFFQALPSFWPPRHGPFSVPQGTLQLAEDDAMDPFQVLWHFFVVVEPFKHTTCWTLMHVATCVSVQAAIQCLWRC